jgi:UDP-glucose 4-epimerase
MSVIWVTGAKGFIGKHLCNYLSQQGNKILGLGHGTWPLEIATQSGLCYWINGEIEDSNLWQLVEHSGYPDIIYHLAGGSSVGLSLQSPTEDFRRTVISTATLLEWIRLHAPKTRLVITSSAAVYGNSQLVSIPEEGNYTPYSPYGFNKQVTETLCQSYSHNFGINIAIVRLFSVYGTGLRKQLLWDLCNRLKTNPPTLIMQGTGDEIRDWFHITDVVRLLDCITNSASSVPFIINGGSGIGTCVRDITNIMCQAWELPLSIKFTGKTRKGDPTSLIADQQKLQSINFYSQADLASELNNYVQWFRQLKEY